MADVTNTGLRWPGGAPLSAQIDISAAAPLDNRTVLYKKENLTDGTITAPYVGMVVNVEGEAALYLLVELDNYGKGNNHKWVRISAADEIAGNLEGVQTKLEQDIKDLIDRVDSDEQKHDNEITGVQTRISDIYDELTDRFDSDEQKHDNEITGVQTQIQSLTDRVDSDEKNHEKDIKGVQGQIQSLTDRVDSDWDKHEKDIQGVQTQLITGLQTLKVDILGDELTDTFDTLKAVQDWADKHGSEYINLVEDLSGVQTELEGVQSALESSINETNENLSEINGELSDKITGVQTELYGVQNNLKQSIKDLETKVNDGVQSSLEEIYTKIGEDEGKHKSDVEGLQQEIDDLTSSLNTKEGNINTRIGNLETKHGQEIAGVQTQLSDEVGKLTSRFVSDEDKHQKDIDGIQSRITSEVEVLTQRIDSDCSKLEDEIAGVQNILTQTITNFETRFDSDEKKHDEDIEGIQNQITEGLQTLKNQLLGSTELDETLDTIVEISTWIQGHQGEYEDLLKLHEDDVKSVETKHTEDIAGVQGQIVTSELYKSDADDTWNTIAVGGVKANTKISSFEGKTTSEVLDMILFPTLYPTKTDPSVSISISKTLYKVGESIPQKTGFTVNESRGTVTYKNAEGNTYYAGAIVADSKIHTITPGEFGGTFAEGTYTVKYSATFADGAQPYNNKGNTEGVTIATFKSATKTATTTLYAVSPIYMSTTTAGVVTEYSLVNYLTGNKTLTGINVPVEALGDTKRFEIHLPPTAKLVSVKLYNGLSGKYDINLGTMIADGTVEHNGLQYKKYIRTKDTSDAKTAGAKVEIIIGK
ncbi:MAG: hypothetical protein NC548_24735 [Lachnospiraceae bacterium]|nr:hypothetical protein [Lachnospiraceae bacterium]